MAVNPRSLFGGGEAARELFVWAVLAELIRALGAPLFQEFTQLVNALDPIQALAVADAVDAVVKGHLNREQGAFEAAKSGIDGQHFDVLVAAAGQPPGLEFLLEAWRRQFIPRSGTGAESVSLEQGIRDSRLHNKWIDVIEKMGFRPIAVSDAIDAWVEGQISEAEARAICYENGISADSATILFHTRGRPPSPTELNVLFKRGLIPMEGVGPDQTSVQQGIFEGATKDKWWRLLADLAEYVPPPRTVTALIREGVLTDQEGLDELRRSGLPDQLAGQYVAAAHHQKTQTERELAKTDILELYAAHLIAADQAKGALKLLGYNAEDQGFLLAYTDFKTNKARIDALVSRIRTFYIGRRLGDNAARGALSALGLDSGAIDGLLRDWHVVRASNVKTLTEAQVANAFHRKIIDQPTAINELLAMGYDPWTAWVELSTREGAPLPGEPPRGPTPLQ